MSTPTNLERFTEWREDPCYDLPPEFEAACAAASNADAVRAIAQSYRTQAVEHLARSYRLDAQASALEAGVEELERVALASVPSDYVTPWEQP
jgi:hypothetical protein